MDGNVLLVGDAAGLLDPLTWEGIFASFLSGQAAAKTLVAYTGGSVKDLNGYRSELERGLLPEALVPAGGVKKRAARLLQISFRSFRYRMEKLGLDDSKPGKS